MERAQWNALEQLEKREVLALAGVSLGQLPLGFFNATGQMAYDAQTQSFDVVATPTSVFLPGGPPRAITAGHGDFQVHAKIDAGKLDRGVNGADTAGLGSITPAGDDLIVRGSVDLNGNGTIDPGESGVLLTAEIYDFGFLDSGGPTDSYDFRFAVTGGLLAALLPAGADVGLTLTSEASTFQGSFSEDFSGNAKGTFGPIGAPQPSSIGGTVYCDDDQSGSLTAGDAPLGNVPVRLQGTNDAGMAVDLTTATDEDGSYSFAGLRPGVYTITETKPDGAVDATNTVGTAGGALDGADSITAITLASGVTASGYNFGYLCLGEIAGRKFLDVTGNGLTADDTPLAGTTIYLDADNDGRLDAGEISRVTGPDGSYSFDGLLPGSYTVREVVPSNMIRTGPTLSDKHTVSLGVGETVSGLDFANAERCEPHSLKYVKYIINDCRVVYDLRGNTSQGDEVKVVFTVPSGSQPHAYTLVSYTAPGPVFVAGEAAQQEIFDLDTGVFGPGTHSLTVRIPGCYYQIDFVCGLAIDRFGPANSNIFYTPQGRLISADNGGRNACGDCEPASISGIVWVDSDNDGRVDDGEDRISGAKIVLSWTQDGRSRSAVRYTDSQGRYSFNDLKADTYRLTEYQPDGYADGKDAVGTAGGSLSNDRISSINLSAGQNATGYNFGERIRQDTVGCGDTAEVSFWKSWSGQSLIKKLNGGSSATKLGTWLAANLPNLFGSAAGSANNLHGKSNSYVASRIASLAQSSSKALEAQVLATALSVYVTSSNLAGGTMAASYGFAVTAGGSGQSVVNVSWVGSLIGLPNNTSQTLMDVLRGVNSKASAGTVYSGNSGARTTLYYAFATVNDLGQID